MATSTRTQKEADTGIDRLSQGAHDAVDRAAQAASSVAERFGEKSDELWEMQENWVQGARWIGALSIGALPNIAGAGVLGWWIKTRVPELPFAALLRQLRGEPPLPPETRH